MNINNQIEYLVFDVETTGFPTDWNAPISRLNNWPRIVQIGWLAFDGRENLLSSKSHIIKPDGYTIPEESVKVHGITSSYALTNGAGRNPILNRFTDLVKASSYVIAHNMNFDEKIVRSELLRAGIDDHFDRPSKVCTKESGTDICQLPGKYGYKWPTLEELYRHFYEDNLEGAHDALNDARATANCFFKLKDLNVI